MYITKIKREVSPTVAIKTEPGITTTPAKVVMASTTTTNFRKQRILLALKSSSVPHGFKSVPFDLQQTADMLNMALEKRSPPPTQVAAQVAADTQLDHLTEMKLKVLENWELTKRSAIEKLAEEIEELQALEERIEKGERELSERGCRRNENIFKKFCAGGQLRISSTPKTQRDAKRIKLSPGHESRKTSPTTRKITKPIVFQQDHENSQMVVIGPNGTTMSRRALNEINYNLTGAAVTRKILMEVFDRDTLAFHTLTGKPSPAFIDCDKPLKNRLDPLKVEDIIYMVTTNLPMTPKEVRSAITTKCADENKMYRQREKKRLRMEASQRKPNV